MKNICNILIALLMATPLVAQVRQEQDFRRSFSVEENTKVEVISKYGEIIVHAWERDSVRFQVIVRAEGKTSAMVNKSMSRVDVKFRKIGHVISAVTEISSGGGFFGNVLNEMEGVMGSNKLKIDYQVWIPDDVTLSVTNKFGDVYLARMDGKVDLEVSHGDIKANEFVQPVFLNHSFGKASFRKVNNGIFTLRGSDIDVGEAINLNVESGSSEIRIDKLGSMQLNSRNDKIHILDADEIMCEGSFTQLTADMLRRSARLDFSYGDIYIGRIQKDFKNIDITGKSTDINLVLNQASYIQSYIKGPEDRMILPNSMLTMQKEQFADEGAISLSGLVGHTNTTHSQLTIEADGGKLIIAIKETPIFVDKD